MDDANTRIELLLSLRRHREAEKAAREAIGADPQNGTYYTSLSRALLGLDRLSEAEEAAREGIKKSPLSPWAHVVLGLVLNQGRQHQAAWRAGLEVIRLAPTFPAGFLVIANAMAGLKRYGAAHDAALDGLAHDPNNEGLLAAKAWAEFRAERFDMAAETAMSGLSHHPKSDSLLNVLGCIRWTQADKAQRWWEKSRLHREAEQYLSAAVLLDPNEHAGRHNLRANALVYRRWVALWMVPLTAMVCIPVAVVAGRYLARDADFFLGFLAAIGFLAAWILSTCSESSSLVLPLRWLGAPSVPLTPDELRTGRTVWIVFGVIAVTMIALTVHGFYTQSTP